MNQLINELRSGFRDSEYRYGYAESFLDTYIAAQISSLREQRGWDQKELARRMQTGQSAISRLEDVNYSSWSISTLKRLARVFGVRLKVSFEEFATLPTDVDTFSLMNLRRASFENDAVFGIRALNGAQILEPIRTDDTYLRRGAVQALSREEWEQRKKSPKPVPEEWGGANEALVGTAR